MTEFDDVIRRLREERPEASPLELDHIKQRVRRSAARGSRRSRPMKSRLAILGMLVAGMLFTTTGAGVAVTSLSSGNDAATQQYGGESPEVPAVPTPGEVEGEHSNRPNKPAEQPAVQPTRQVEAGAANTTTSGTLPFTGFAAIPVLLIGIALLTTGLVMRRRSASDRS